MSFTNEIKQEIAYNELKDCCAKAELIALLQYNSSLEIRNRQYNLLVKSENPTTLKRVVKLYKKLYKGDTELVVSQKTKLKRNNVYSFYIYEDALKLLEDLGLYSKSKGFLDNPKKELIKKDCCKRAYVAGCFMSYGHCNPPSKTSYHLEITCDSEERANYLIDILNKFNINAKTTIRRNKYVVYLKKADVISDFLRLVGAQESMMNFENQRISRDVVNSINRVDNCLIANNEKSMKASNKIIEEIDYLKEKNKLNQLDEKVIKALDARYKFPDLSLSELCYAYEDEYGEKISKSGLKHRLNKIDELYNEIKGE